MKIVSLISTGIDSPVATYLALKKGHTIIAVHMDYNSSLNENSGNKIAGLIKVLNKYTDKKIKTYIFPHGLNQAEIAQNCRKNMICVLCKRMMLRIAEHVAVLEGASAILTGESLGQVASQTLRNICVEESAIKIPVIRPLIGYDKVDIIGIATKIGTYDLSIAPSNRCTVVPDRPATKAVLDNVIVDEEKIDIEKMIHDMFNNMIVKE